MNNVSTVRVILLKLIAVVIFVLPGTCICIEEGHCYAPDLYVRTDQPGFAKGNWRFLVLNSLKSHWKAISAVKSLAQPVLLIIWNPDSLAEPVKLKL